MSVKNEEHEQSRLRVDAFDIGDTCIQVPLLKVLGHSEFVVDYLPSFAGSEDFLEWVASDEVARLWVIDYEFSALGGALDNLADAVAPLL